MAILINNDGSGSQEWADHLQPHLPEHTLYCFEQLDDTDAIVDDIEYALVWNHPAGELQRYSNLKAILILGAGTEHIDHDATVPRVPIVRLVDPEMSRDMAQYALYWVMNSQRHYDTYRQQQLQQHWQRYPAAAAGDINVLIVGMGEIGTTIAEIFQLNGFRVSGWNRSTKQIAHIDCRFGVDTLQPALREADVVVLCLPKNEHTIGFMNRQRLAEMKSSATLINIGRGAVIDEQALREALDNETISRAVLDVFSEEPLPSDEWYWQHPKVTVTPHMSGATYPRSAAKVIAANIRRIERGETPFPLHSHPAHLEN